MYALLLFHCAVKIRRSYPRLIRSPSPNPGLRVLSDSLNQFRNSLPLIRTDFCLPILHTFAFMHLIAMGTKTTLHGLDRTNVFNVARDMGDLLSTQAIRDSIPHKVLKVSIPNIHGVPVSNLSAEQIVEMVICIHADILAQESNVYSVITLAHIDALRCHLKSMSVMFPTLCKCCAFFRWHTMTMSSTLQALSWQELMQKLQLSSLSVLSHETCPIPGTCSNHALTFSLCCSLVSPSLLASVSSLC